MSFTFMCGLDRNLAIFSEDSANYHKYHLFNTPSFLHCYEINLYYILSSIEFKICIYV